MKPGASELPAGWEWKALGDVATTQLGKMLSAKARGGVNPLPYLRNVNVQWGRIDLDDLREMDFSEAEIAKFSVQRGDLVMCEGGEPGRCAIWDSDDTILFQKALHRIRPGESVIAEWLFYYFRLLAWSGGFAPFTSGIGIEHLPQEDLRLIPVPVPPLEVQQQIVATVDRLFAQMASADEELAAARNCASTLQASAYSEAYARGWPLVDLRSVLRERARNGHSAKATPDGAVRTLSLTAVTLSEFSDQHTKLTGADPKKVADLWLEPGDIFVQRSNTPDLVGSAAMYEGERHWAIFPDLLIRLRTNETMLPEFLNLVLQSREARSYFRASARGTAGSMPKINQGIIEALQVPVPSVAEQEQFFTKVQAKVEQYTQLQRDLNTAVSQSQALRRAVLLFATTGSLKSSSRAIDGSKSENHDAEPVGVYL